MKSEFTVFSKYPCQLGEGVFFYKKLNMLFWLDILKCTIFSKTLFSIKEDYDQKWVLDVIPTAILSSDKAGHILVVTDKWVGDFNIFTGNVEVIIRLDLPCGFRTNDAGYDNNGNLFIGVMEMQPSGKNGYVEIYNKEGRISHRLSGIGIPNTMISCADDTMLISDSYEQKITRYFVDNEDFPSEDYMNFSGALGTPDGGILDGLGNLYFAVWGEGVVAVASPKGRIIDEYALPVPHVSNCCFGGYNDEYLFATSAKEGMCDQDLLRHPLSGCVFKIKL